MIKAVLMDAQAILEDLLCNDVKIKLAALDRFQHRLRLKTNLSDVTVTTIFFCCCIFLPTQARLFVINVYRMIKE